MTLSRFFMYFIYSDVCPQGINHARWRAMMRWYDRRLELGEPFIYQ